MGVRAVARRCSAAAGSMRLPHVVKARGGEETTKGDGPPGRDLTGSSRRGAVLDVQDAVEIAGDQEMGAGRPRRKGSSQRPTVAKEPRPLTIVVGRINADDRPVVAGGGIEPPDAQHAAHVGRVGAGAGPTQDVRELELCVGPGQAGAEQDGNAAGVFFCHWRLHGGC